MFNKVILVGNLTRDPELRYLPSGSAVCNASLATNRRYKKQDGTNGEEVCFIDVAFFGRTAEVANQYLKRGSKVLVEGRLKQDQWTDQNGQKRSKHSVTVDNMQMLDSKNAPSDGGQGGYQSGGNNYQQQEQYQNPMPQAPQHQASQQAPQQNIPEIDIDEGDIPF